ncbi:hypothetical protein E2562_033214 [Oryza meyeriana var. granulata]|uniref:Uncharacterized protein n=1 Tax=Oryza meyeriana var. granulata TaxID=110450 RepID=A0A6G1BQY5_9ORYZ|nr:hypothetical protein E2562_033214 [Oryza meyeriana var. granulata]
MPWHRPVASGPDGVVPWRPSRPREAPREKELREACARTRLAHHLEQLQRLSPTELTSRAFGGLGWFAAVPGARPLMPRHRSNLISLLVLILLITGAATTTAANERPACKPISSRKCPPSSLPGMERLPEEFKFQLAKEFQLEFLVALSLTSLVGQPLQAQRQSRSSKLAYRLQLLRFLHLLQASNLKEFQLLSCDER